MNQYVAFLRGMNLGNRRIRNDELCAVFGDLGFENISAFLASGNVIFDTRRTSDDAIAEYLERGLREALGYVVPTFLRTAAETTAIAGHKPFPQTAGSAGGKLQVALLRERPSPAARSKVAAMSSDRDRLAVRGRELYWLPAGNMSKSELDLSAIETILGPMTIRTKRTMERITGLLRTA